MPRAKRPAPPSLDGDRPQDRTLRAIAGALREPPSVRLDHDPRGRVRRPGLGEHVRMGKDGQLEWLTVVERGPDGMPTKFANGPPRDQPRIGVEVDEAEAEYWRQVEAVRMVARRVLNRLRGVAARRAKAAVLHEELVRRYDELSDRGRYAAGIVAREFGKTPTRVRQIVNDARSKRK